VARDVAITGIGAVSALGPSAPALWAAVEDGRCGIATIRRFDTSDMTVHTGALVGSGDRSRPPRDMCVDFAVCAAREALASAGLEGSRPRTALALGTGLVDGRASLDSLVEAVADAVGADGPRIGVSTACSSSTGALGVGCDLLALGAADFVLAGGSDVVTPEVFAGFHALGVLAHGACAPFSTPAGTTLGEGAGFLVLERAGSARARGARPRAFLAGYGLSADAWHETSPDPRGAGVERAVRAALGDAGVRGDEIGYVNAHGSGTQANDSAEWLGISRALGPASRPVPVSSTKGALGHAQGAAGALEAIVTIEAMDRGLLPPTLNFAGPRPHAPEDPVPGPYPRPSRYGCAVSANSAFGGANAAVVLSREPRAPEARARASRAVRLRGLGVREEIEPRALESLVPGADARGLDPASALLTASAALALRDARVVLSGERRGRCGLLVGQCRPSPESLRAFSCSIAERGLARLSASAFARIVLNAAAGFCSKLLGARGPLTVLAAGPASGLAAVVLAAHWLATRDDVGLVLAASVSEEDPDAPAGAATGAVGLLLEAEGEGRPAGPRDSREGITLAGWGLAGPGGRDEAVAHAAPAGLDPGALVLGTRATEEDPLEGMLLLATAVRALRAGEARTALVASGSGRSLAAALHLVG
jgi:3-oxoacyl-[acyl-carrier-protein] synthase II